MTAYSALQHPGTLTTGDAHFLWSEGTPPGWGLTLLRARHMAQLCPGGSAQPITPQLKVPAHLCASRCSQHHLIPTGGNQSLPCLGKKSTGQIHLPEIPCREKSLVLHKVKLSTDLFAIQRHSVKTVYFSTTKIFF